MAAVYPGNVAVFSTKIDLVDTVFAAHINTLQDEVRATQEVLGTSPLQSTWSSTFEKVTTHNTVGDRLQNIEGGLRFLETDKLSLSGGSLTGLLQGTSGTFSGTISATTLVGSGESVTNVNASNVTSGTLAWQRLQDSSVSPGTYAKVTVDSKGRVVGSSFLAQEDMPAGLEATFATRWKTPRTLSLTGAVSGSASVDGSGDVALSTQLNDIPMDFTPHFMLMAR